MGYHSSIFQMGKLRLSVAGRMMCARPPPQSLHWFHPAGPSSDLGTVTEIGHGASPVFSIPFPDMGTHEPSPDGREPPVPNYKVLGQLPFLLDFEPSLAPHLPPREATP